jgi:hypothetical protein
MCYSWRIVKKYVGRGVKSGKWKLRPTNRFESIGMLGQWGKCVWDNVRPYFGSMIGKGYH